MKYLLFLGMFFVLLSANVRAQNTIIESVKTKNGLLHIQPILHSSFVLTYNNTTIYIDPYGGSKLYEGIQAPDLILITDIHGDHLNPKTLDSIDTTKTILIVPQEVANKLTEKYISKAEILANGQAIHRLDFFIEAIPMYNLPEEPDAKHIKGRGNGYVVTVDNTRIYISGDTEDISEMRSLQNIDVAFVCMNLPYTMDINQAASAVLEFQPKIVYPYHYRGADGFSDVNEFKKLVNAINNNIEVRLINWYPNN